MFLNENFIPPAWMFVRLSTSLGTHGGASVVKGGEKGIKKWSAPFGKPPPSSPDKYSNWRLCSVLPFMVSIKSTSGGGGQGYFDVQ